MPAANDLMSLYMFTRCTLQQGMDVTFGPILIYNRVITEAENTANYNVFKTRYIANSSSSSSNSSSTAVCFLGNAPVLTPRGYRRIESLEVGDMVTTADGRHVKIQKVFAKEYQPSSHVDPFIIPKGQFGARTAVAISPNHRVAVPGSGLIEARHLGLEQQKMTTTFTYYNLELPNWETDNLVVGGVEVESLAPVRRIEITKGEFLALIKAKYGKLTPAIIEKLVGSCVLTKEGKVNIPLICR